MKLSIVIPAYNEQARISRSLHRIANFMRTVGWDYEVILVDDGSQDRTAEVAREVYKEYGSRLRVLRNEPNRGKGYSVKRGMLEAAGEYVLFTDADLSTPIEEAEKLIAALKKGADAAIGSRDLPDSRVIVHQHWTRELMGKTFNRMAKALTFKGVMDSQCGFKAFRNAAAKDLFSRQRMNGFSFDVEIVYLAQKLGYQLVEVPVSWVNDPKTKVSIFSDPVKMFWDLFRIRFIHWRTSREQR